MPDEKQILEALNVVIDPLRRQDRRLLRRIALRLKCYKGEWRAAGEVIERACMFLDLLEEAERKAAKR